MSLCNTLRSLRDLTKESGGELREVQVTYPTIAAIIDELNVEQGRTIDPPKKGEQLPDGTDMSKVKFGPSSVVVLDGIHVVIAP